MLIFTAYVASFMLCYNVSLVYAFCDHFDFTSCRCPATLDKEWCWICPCPILSTTPSTTSTTAPTTRSTTMRTVTAPTMPLTSSKITHASLPPTKTTMSITVKITNPTISPIKGSFVSSTAGDQFCLQCDKVVSPHTCSTLNICGSKESCYVDSFVNHLGGILYRLGCRDTNQCSISGKRELSSSTERRHTHSGQVMHNTRGTSDLSVDTVLDDTGTLVMCSQCCNGSLCNTGGCGVIPFTDMRLGTRGPMCFSCPQQSRADDCDVFRLCGRDQMCRLEQITISDIVLWRTSCEDARTCLMLMNNAGTNCTSTCCASDLCNNECPAKCRIIHCQLDCGSPPNYKKDINGCDVCVCDTGSGTHALIG
ncbi:uncharacterized protein LOC127869342 isoform X1 [Dreissena polymorpha]|uniref:uncharacterized protein LOC127869342 isoform X1 n=1 Tax=Dreissena polymorpha TaxID=45954 RepID=UPI002264C33F|nr:uncharacterized protein LOC127869342 isoform X1 [Dreissena polymorpha]